MGRLGCWLGFFLMTLAMVAMFALVVLPVIGPFRDNATLMSLQAAINCPPGYTFENEFTTYSRPGETMDVATGYCISPDNEKRTELTPEQQGRFFLIAVGVFVIPFIIGLFMFIAGVNVMTHNSVRSAVQTGRIPFVNTGPVQSPGTSVSYVTTSSGNPIDPKISAMIRRTTGLDLDELHQQAHAQGSASVMSVSDWSDNTNLSGGSLSERLKQIDDARDQGLISKEEYERLRKAILNDLV